MTILAGLALCAVGLAAVGFNTSKIIKDEYTMKTYDASCDAVKSIAVLAQNRAVEVKLSQEDVITLTYAVSDDDDYIVTLENGLLALKSKRKLENRIINTNLFGLIANEHKTITVSLPASYVGALDMDTSNGKISIEGVKLDETLKATSSNASVILTNARAVSMNVKSSNGSVKLTGVDSIDGIHVKTSNASITLEGVRATGSTVLETSNGSVSVNRVACTATVSVKTSNGSIKTSALRAPDISLVTSNSGVSGTIDGDEKEYAIESKTSNGSNSLGNRDGGDKKLYVKTSNASIKLAFEQVQE